MEDKRTRIDMKDFYLIAFVIAEGGKIVKVSPDHTDLKKKRKIFTLETPADYDQKLRDYRNRVAKTNVRVFIEAIRDIRKIIYEDPI